MNYLLAAKLRYYAENNSNNILKKVNSSISRSITTCRPELLCILDDMVSIEPCSYWNKDVFETTEKNLQNIVQKGNSIFINEEIFELFLAGYHAYMQITNVINDLSGVNDSPAMKNRQYRIPTYVSIVEGCLTNLYHFITLLIIAKNNALCIIKFLLSNEGFQGLSPDKRTLWYHKGDACWYIADLFSLRGRTFFETSRKQSQSSSLSAIQPPQAGQRCSHSSSG